MILVLPPLGLTHQSTYPTWTIKKQARIQKKTPPVKHGSNVVFAWVPASGKKKSWPNIIYPKYQKICRKFVLIREIFVDPIISGSSYHGGKRKVTWGISIWRCFGRPRPGSYEGCWELQFFNFFLTQKNALNKQPKGFVCWLEMSI